MHPESGILREVYLVGVFRVKAGGGCGGATVNGHVGSHVGIVVGEPNHSADGIGKRGAHLHDHAGGSLLGGDGTLVEIFLPFVVPKKRSGTIGRRVESATGIRGEVKGSALIVVTHGVHHLRQRNGLGRFEPKGQRFGGADVATIHGGKILVHAFHKVVEETPSTGIADSERGEVCRSIRLRERELGVGTVKISLGASKGDDVRRTHHVLLVLHVEAVNAALVRVARNAVVRNAHGNPDNALLVGSLAYHLENPNFVRVTNGEGFAGGGVAIFIDQRGHDANGFAGGLGTLKGERHERGVVHDSLRVHELLASAEGGFSHADLVFVDVAHDGVGVSRLRNGAERATGVSFHDGAHRAFGMVRGGIIAQTTEHAIVVLIVGDERRTVGGSQTTDQKTGAGKGGRDKEKEQSHAPFSFRWMEMFHSRGVLKKRKRSENVSTL